MTVGGQPGQQDMGAGVTPFHPPPPFATAHPALPAVVCTPTVRRAAETLQAQNTRRSSSTTSGDGNTSSQPGGGSGRYGRSTADGPAKDGSKVELRRARRFALNGLPPERLTHLHLPSPFYSAWYIAQSLAKHNSIDYVLSVLISCHGTICKACIKLITRHLPCICI